MDFYSSSSTPPATAHHVFSNRAPGPGVVPRVVLPSKMGLRSGSFFRTFIVAQVLTETSRRAYKHIPGRAPWPYEVEHYLEHLDTDHSSNWLSPGIVEE